MTSRDPDRSPVPPPAAADAELLAALRAGDREALGELYSRHRPRVAAYLGRRMVCAGDVEDVVQDTFLRLWNGTEKFDPATHGFSAWLCGRVARWTLIDYGRRDRFRQQTAVDIARDHARRQPTESAHQRETTPVSPRVVTALARLTPAQRRSVQLRYLDGHSTAAAAIVAGSSPGAIATNSLAARERLRVELADLAPTAHPLAAGSKLDAVRAAFVAVGAHDVGAALGWLRERGIEIDPSYAYAIRNHRRGGSAAPELDTARDAAAEPQRDVDAVRAADLGVGITSRDAERGAEPASVDVAGEREPSIGAQIGEPAGKDSTAAVLERAETAVAGARREAAAAERQRVERDVEAGERTARAHGQQQAGAEREAAADRVRRDEAERERAERPERDRQTDRLADPGPEPGRCAA